MSFASIQRTSKGITSGARPAPAVKAPAVKRTQSAVSRALALSVDRISHDDQRTSHQTGLRVSAPGDTYEQEADGLANEVMLTPPHRSLGNPPAQIQRFATESNGQMKAPAGTSSMALASPGKPLEPALRQDMEHRFGSDFSRVRIHQDASAEQSAQNLNADAYTFGHDIVFGAGRFAPRSGQGHRLLAHELAHVMQQQGSGPVIQRQPKEKSKFDFITANVEGREEVLEVLQPTDTAEFLKAFQEKGEQLIDAEFKWLSNNLIQFTADAVIKQKRNPFANISLETLRDVAGRAYEKGIGALLVRGTSEAASKLVKLITFSKKVIYVGKTGGKFLSRFGGFLAWVGSALVQLLIGPLFDKTNELVKQAVQQFGEAMQKVVNETIIPNVRKSTTLFDGFMASLNAYLLQDTEEPPPKRKSKPGADTFSVGEGDYAVKLEIDTSLPLTDRREREIILDLANVVLGIDEVVPQLETDLSLYNELAQRAGVYSKGVAPASPKPVSAGNKPIAAYDRPFKVTALVKGETDFDVPAQGSVVVTSEAHYTDGDWKDLPEFERPPSSYKIDLYPVGGRKPEAPTKEYPVDKAETAAWYNLDAGKYYLVIYRGGNPNFALQGNVHIDVYNH